MESTNAPARTDPKNMTGSTGRDDDEVEDDFNGPENAPGPTAGRPCRPSRGPNCHSRRRDDVAPDDDADTENRSGIVAEAPSASSASSVERLGDVRAAESEPASCPDGAVSDEAAQLPHNSPAPLAFTIDFGDNKEIDTARYQNLFQRYNARHRRNLSTSKVRLHAPFCE